MTRLANEPAATTTTTSLDYLKGLIMNRTCITSSLFVLSTLCAGAAQAQTAVTREQIKADFAQAVRDGDVAPAGEGMTLRQMYPGRYATEPIAAAKTRAEVKLELAEAIRTGDIVEGETGMKLNELYPRAYPATAVAVAGKTRAQVKLELAEAIRNGDIVEGETGMKLNELYPRRYAAARSANMLAQGSGAAASAVAR